MQFTSTRVAASLALALALGITTPLAAQEFTNETPRSWFVELASPPTADGGSAATIASEHANFRSQAARAGIAYTARYSYSSLFNGFSIRLAAKDVAKLSVLPGVQRIYPVGSIPIPETVATDTADQQDWLKMTGADYAQNELGLRGDGVRVAVIDTGIDYHHPDLGGCFGAGCRVEKGYDFVGDKYDGTNEQVPDPDPMDCAGHGTHVSGIIGADGGGQAGHVTGVAPHVKFHIYRVFGCTGFTSTDNVVAALEMALADGADIVSMSLGDDFNSWSESPDAQASDRLVRKGIVVVAAAGNAAANGTYSTGAPSTGKKVISVASYENLTLKLREFTASPDNAPILYLPAAGGGPGSTPPTSGTFPMAKTGTDTTTNDGCGPIAADLTGKVVLIRRGTCTFDIKAFNAQTAHAAGVVLYNNRAGYVTPAITARITIPVVMIAAADGALLNTRIATGPTTMTWTDQFSTSANPTAGLVSSFSSFGPTAELDLKPDLGAPGGNIFSTWPLTQGGYATLSGTSMATPHVSGSVALLLQARPHTPPPLVRELLQNNAVPANWNGNPGLGFLDNVTVQGAGLIHIDRTVLRSVSVSPGKLALGDSAGGPSTQTLTFTNSASANVTYDLSQVAALATGATEFSVSEFVAPAIVSFSAPSVTVPAGGSASVTATITAPATPALYTYGGYIVVTPRSSGDTLRVPYMGVVDYQAVNVLGLRSSGLPLLSHGDFNAVSDGEVFNVTNNDLPTIVLQLAHASRTLSADVYSAPATPGGPLGKNWHLAFKFEFNARNATSSGVFVLPFDGTTSNGRQLNTLPAGNYIIVLTALQPLGDPANPRSVETWQSPMFTISR